VRLGRKEIFRRDEYTCQYCGIETRNLTMDHVIPRHRGGSHSWENLVSACHACNIRKGGKTLAETKMRLLREPFEPHPTGDYLFGTHLVEHSEWGKFLRGWWE
jgi:5-methylcytosine-specific restriction endonuclease McrA